MLARTFRDLDVYKKARTATREIFDLTKRFPREETYSMTDQVRRSSRAVKAMIAEAWARRQYKAVFVNKLSEALGEAVETQSWLDDALDCQYVTQKQHTALDATMEDVSAMLYSMMTKADLFCQARS